MQRPSPVDLSVVIVCLNALAGLKETLDSLDAQHGWRPRVYVVDGASTDGTAAYLANCPHTLAGWISERDRGIYDAMNKGWNMAADDSYILYLGAGDKLLSLPSRESVSQDHADGTDIVIGTCHLGNYVFHSMWYSDLFLNNVAHHQTLMVHKSLWPESPFDTTFRVYGDWEFNARLFAAGRTARHYDEFRSYALPGGISARRHVRETFRVAMRYGGVLNGIHAVLRTLKAKAKHSMSMYAEKRAAKSSLGSGGARSR